MINCSKIIIKRNMPENVEYQHSFCISISKMYDMVSIWSSLFKPIIHRSVRNAYIMLNCAPFVKYVHSQCQLSSADFTLGPFFFFFEFALSNLKCISKIDRAFCIKEVAFTEGKSENQADKKFFIRFSIDNLIANISLYALSWGSSKN